MKPAQFLAACVVFSFALLAVAADPQPTPPNVSITDGNGETIKLKSAKITAGTRRLAWLADPKGTTDLAKKGPEAFELREVGSSSFVHGVVTLVPLTSIESLTYDTEKKQLQLKAAGIEKPMIGTMEYQGLNAISLDAEVDKGMAGVAVVKYRGGAWKGGIRGVTFTDAKAFERKGADKLLEWSVQISDQKAKNPTITVSNLQPLYHFPDNTEKIIGTLPFQKTLKLDWSEIRGLKLEAPMMKGQTADMVVTTKDGKDQTLSPMATLEVDGKKASLLGLIGDVPGGYKLVPIHTIMELKAK